MQLNLLTLDGLLCVQHVLNHLSVRGARRVYADHALRLVLAFLVRSLLLLVLLIAVQRSLSGLVGIFDGGREYIIDIVGHRFV